MKYNINFESFHYKETSLIWPLDFLDNIKETIKLKRFSSILRVVSYKKVFKIFGHFLILSMILKVIFYFFLKMHECIRLAETYTLTPKNESLGKIVDLGKP